jgi:mRNA interferase YafQ
MRAIEPTKQYDKDMKREMKGQHRATLQTLLKPVITALVNDQPMPPLVQKSDHVLSSNWKGHRECHVLNDLLLIYRKDGDVNGTLILTRIGSHSELFG